MFAAIFFFQFNPNIIITLPFISNQAVTIVSLTITNNFDQAAAIIFWDVVNFTVALVYNTQIIFSGVPLVISITIESLLVVAEVGLEIANAISGTAYHYPQRSLPLLIVYVLAWLPIMYELFSITFSYPS